MAFVTMPTADSLWQSEREREWKSKREKCKRKSITEKDASDYQAFALMATDKSSDLITTPEAERAMDLFSLYLQVCL